MFGCQSLKVKQPMAHFGSPKKAKYAEAGIVKDLTVESTVPQDGSALVQKSRRSDFLVLSLFAENLYFNYNVDSGAEFGWRYQGSKEVQIFGGMEFHFVLNAGLLTSVSQKGKFNACSHNSACNKETGMNFGGGAGGLSFGTNLGEDLTLYLGVASLASKIETVYNRPTLCSGGTCLSSERWAHQENFLSAVVGVGVDYSLPSTNFLVSARANKNNWTLADEGSKSDLSLGVFIQYPKRDHDENLTTQLPPK
jgi:hypothetical protein